MNKPLKVVQKNRFRNLTIPLANASNLRPELASGDYILFPIHDGSSSAIRASRDSYFGQAEVRTRHWQWYSLDIALTYDDLDPEAPIGSKVHYMLKAYTPFQVDFHAMKCYVNRILVDLYAMLGRGTGSVYASIMTKEQVEKLIAEGKIEDYRRDPTEKFNFEDFKVGFTDDLHYVDPATIPTWVKPVQQ